MCFEKQWRLIFQSSLTFDILFLTSFQTLNFASIFLLLLSPMLHYKCYSTVLSITKLVVLILSLKVLSVVGPFYVGKTDHCINEMGRLNGRMSPREAVIKCESDEECAGFTYHGPKNLVDGYTYQITFYL